MSKSEELWNNLQLIIQESENNVIVYDSDNAISKNTLEALKLSPTSVLGNVLLKTSGIVINNWIRVIGSGDDLDRRNIVTWNKKNKINGLEKILLVADDVIGGIYALNFGGFVGDMGVVWYFAPDTLQWESLEMQYSEFFVFIMSENINQFYKGLRWTNWNESVLNIGFEESVLIYPFVWSAECDIETATKKVVPSHELFSLNFDNRGKTS